MGSYFLFFFSLVFDYKGVVEGGSWIQLTMFVLATITGAYIIIRTSKPVVVSRWSAVVGRMLVMHLLSTVVVVLIQGVEIDRYVRTALPYFFLVLGYFVGVRAIAQIGFNKTVGLLMAASSVSAIYTFIYGLATGDFSVNGIRYQILSPALFVLVPVLSHKLFVEKERTYFVAIILLGILATILISATRSWLIAYLGVILLAICISKARSLVSFIKGGIISLVVGGAMFSIIFVTFASVMPDVIDRLVQRITLSQEVGFDMTAATRVAEMEYQINAWLSDIPSFLIGKGLGASYGFSGQALVQLYSIFGSSSITEIDWWFAGHNFWVYSFFSQGLLFGWVVPFVFMLGIFLSLRRLTASWSLPSDPGKSISSKSKLCLLVLVSIVMCTVGSNPLGSRILSQYIGVIFSLAIGYNSMTFPRFSGHRVRLQV